MLLWVSAGGHSLLLWLIHAVLSSGGGGSRNGCGSTGSVILLLLILLLGLWLPVHCVLLLLRLQLLLRISASDHVITSRHKAVDHLTGKVEHVSIRGIYRVRRRRQRLLWRVAVTTANGSAAAARSRDQTSSSSPSFWNKSYEHLLLPPCPATVYEDNSVHVTHT